MSDRRNAVHQATRFIAQIARIDEEQRMVWGYASTTAIAGDGKSITLDAMKNALDDYMAFANVREMHQLWAAGVTKEATVDDKGMFVAVHVVDDAAWEKVKTGVYKAFSIGAQILSLVGNVIHALAITEISLVDRPSDPEALFTMWRAQPSQETTMTKPAAAKATKPTVVAEPKAAALAAVERAESAADAVTDPASAAGAVTPAPEAVTAPEGEAIERAEGDAPADAGDPTDPLSQAAIAAHREAMASMEAVERARGIEPAVIRVLPGAELRRSFYDVKGLICILQDLAYYVYNADWEAKVEGTGSSVPNKLRDALRSLADAYKAMSDEELAELLTNAGVGDVQRALAAVNLAAASSPDAPLSDEQKADVQRALDAFVKRGFALPTVAAPAEGENEEFTRVKSELETEKGKVQKLESTVGELTGGMQELNRRLTALANEPLPPKAAASPLARAVSKSEDADPPSADRKEGEMTQAEFNAAMAQLTPTERAMVEMRRTLSNPMAISPSMLAPARKAPKAEGAAT